MGDIVLFLKRQMRKLGIVEEEKRMNVTIIINAEEQMRSIYVHSDLGLGLLMLDPKQ